jgi:hypothetical protein
MLPEASQIIAALEENLEDFGDSGYGNKLICWFLTFHYCICRFANTMLWWHIAC